MVFFASVGGTISGISGSIGWSNQAGWNAGIGAGLGIGIPGLSTNMTSAGIGWSQNGGFYASAAGITIDQSGSVSFNPGLTYSYSLKYERRPIKGGASTACVGCRYLDGILSSSDMKVIGHTKRFYTGPGNFYINGPLNWLGKHFEAGGGFQVSYGAQIGLEFVKNGLGGYVNGGSMVAADGYYSFSGRSEKLQFYYPNEKSTTGFGIDLGGGTEYKTKIDSNGYTESYSAGFMGFGFDMEFDGNQNLTNWFVGYKFGSSIRLVFGIEAELKIGFQK